MRAAASVEAFQERLICDVETAVADIPEGIVGEVVSGVGAGADGEIIVTSRNCSVVTLPSETEMIQRYEIGEEP